MTNLNNLSQLKSSKRKLLILHLQQRSNRALLRALPLIMISRIKVIHCTALLISLPRKTQTAVRKGSWGVVCRHSHLVDKVAIERAYGRVFRDILINMFPRSRWELTFTHIFTHQTTNRNSVIFQICDGTIKQFTGKQKETNKQEQCWMKLVRFTKGSYDFMLHWGSLPDGQKGAFSFCEILPWSLNRRTIPPDSSVFILHA